MKVLILACLVALALAGEEEISVSTVTIKDPSNTEESITNINKQKTEESGNEKQQQKEDGYQGKIQFYGQPQPFLYPHAEPISYTVFPQNVLPLAQPAVVLPVFQPEVIQVPSAKGIILPKHHMMPFLKSPGVPTFERQIPNIAQFPLPLLQPVMHQVPQPLFQSPMLPTQSLLSLPMPQALPLSQQVITYPQTAMPNQEPLSDPTSGSYPGTQPVATVNNLKQN